MLTERQARYAFVCCWLFVLTASNAFYIPKKGNEKPKVKKDNIIIRK